MITTYEPLTKIETNYNGKSEVVCRFSGTEECRLIHKPNGCGNCPVFAAILQQLNIFEKIYMEDDK